MGVFSTYRRQIRLQKRLDGDVPLLGYDDIRFRHDGVHHIPLPPDALTERVEHREDQRRQHRVVRLSVQREHEPQRLRREAREPTVRHRVRRIGSLGPVDGLEAVRVEQDAPERRGIEPRIVLDRRETPHQQHAVAVPRLTHPRSVLQKLHVGRFRSQEVHGQTLLRHVRNPHRVRLVEDERREFPVRVRVERVPQLVRDAARVPEQTGEEGVLDVGVHPPQKDRRTRHGLRWELATAEESPQRFLRRFRPTALGGTNDQLGIRGIVLKQGTVTNQLTRTNEYRKVRQSHNLNHIVSIVLV